MCVLSIASKVDSRPALQDRSDPQPVSVHSAGTGHFTLRLGAVPHWPESSGEDAEWWLDPDAMTVHEMGTSSEIDAEILGRRSTAERVGSAVNQLRIEWLEKGDDTFLIGASPADTEASFYSLLHKCTWPC